MSKRLKLTAKEKITLLKEGYIEIQRGFFTIVITCSYWGECEIMIINPYDTKQLTDEISSLANHLR